MAFFQSPGNGKKVDPLMVIRSYLSLAIQIGAPAYNHGDHRGCYEVYACTARMLLQAVEGADDAKQQLKEALQIDYKNEISNGKNLATKSYALRTYRRVLIDHQLAVLAARQAGIPLN